MNGVQYILHSVRSCLITDSTCLYLSCSSKVQPLCPEILDIKSSRSAKHVVDILLYKMKGKRVGSIAFAVY